ncbi:MAG: RluA family pseudouridine synthase, partial [Pseudomonadota bacterium]
MQVVVEESGRADAALAKAVDTLSRTRAQALIRAGAVELNGAPLLDTAARVVPGDILVVDEPPPAPAEPVPQAIPLDVLYEDEALIVINKPAGLVVHPAAGHADGTLVNALLGHCGDSLSGIGGVMRPGIVHRLDKDTSGVMVVAKSDRAHQSLAAQFADHGRTGPLTRRYEAIVWGAPSPHRGTIDKPIGRHPADRQRFAVRPTGKPAITHYETRAASAKVS